MDLKDINLIIDNICDKLGIAANNIYQLVPQLAHYKMGVSLFGAAISLIVFIYAFSVATRLLRCDKEDSKWHYMSKHYEEEACIYFLVGGIASVVSFISFCYYAYEAIAWGVAPDVKAIEFVLSKFNK